MKKPVLVVAAVPAVGTGLRVETRLVAAPRL